MDLFAWFRVNRKLLDVIAERNKTIDEQNAIYDQLLRAKDVGWDLAGANGRLVGDLQDQVDALQAQFANVQQALKVALDERNAAYCKADEWGEKNAALANRVEELTAERDQLRDERDVLAKERDDAIRDAFASNAKIERIDAVLHPPIDADPGDEDFVRRAAQDEPSTKEGA